MLFYFALAVASSASGAPAKLMVFTGDGVAVTDYPSLARCEAARERLLATVKRENDSHPPQYLPNGGVVVTTPITARAICIQG